MLTLANVAASGSKLPVGDAGITAVLGYAVVFLGLVLLMYVIILTGKIMVASVGKKKTAEEAAAPAVPENEPPKAAPAPGSVGEVKLYDTSDRDAAMIMAIVADKTGRPLNELWFKSIREVK